MTAITELLVSVSVHRAPRGRYVAVVNGQTVSGSSWSALKDALTEQLDCARLEQSSLGWDRARVARAHDSKLAAVRRETHRQRLAPHYFAASQLCSCSACFCPLSV